MITLTEEQAETLESDNRVAEVVEDFEVHALVHWSAAGKGQSGDDKHANMYDLDALQQAYMAGYLQAIVQMQIGQGMGSPSSSSWPFGPNAAAPPPWWPFPWWPFPSKPTPPPDQKQPIPWNIAMINAPAVWDRVAGRGVKVAIIDTGIDEAHSDLTVYGGASFVPGAKSWDDDNGHGTHCAGIVGARNNATGVVGVAPECQLYAVKVLNRLGSGQFSWILAGMGWAVDNDMEVVSMSLGSDVDDPNMDCVLAYQRAAQNLIDNGAIVVAAAGNAGETKTPWVGQPARCPGYMAVAAVDRDKNLASFSSRGPATLGPLQGVEIAAPGVSIESTWRGGGYRTISGTSMACPHVSGAAALLKELHPTWTPDQIRDRLKATAADLGVPGSDPNFGAGLLDCQAAVFG